jgi:UDP-2,3-diacylglucosamine pyrophosphatase LpxH
MKLKFLAISDAHLGEDTSLLTFPQGRQRVWEALREAFGEGAENKRFEVEEAILLGDFPDRCLSSTVQIIDTTTMFMRMLGSAAKITKGVYIPGNHDHTLWTNYILAKYNLKSKITPPEGELLLKKGQVHTDPVSAEELLTIFFGYSKGSLWKEINRQKEFDFVVANPLYAKVFKGRTYVFTHGTLFRPDVAQPKWIKRIADWSQADRIAGIEIDSDCDVSKATDLEDLEMRASGLVDSLWPSSFDNPNNRSDRLWYILNLISGKFSLSRKSPPADHLYTLNELQTKRQNWVKKLVSNNNRVLDESVNLYREVFADHMYEFLDDHKLLKPDVTFVYGDTHRGGWGELKHEGKNVRIYNTGGWGTTSETNHPACHIFAVDLAGKEYMLDVSYEGVDVLGKSLIEIAAKDAEDRNSAFGKLIQFFI